MHNGCSTAAFLNTSVRVQVSHDVTNENASGRVQVSHVTNENASGRVQISHENVELASFSSLFASLARCKK